MKLTTAKLLPETLRLAKQQAAARGMFLYEYLDELVRRDSAETAVVERAFPHINHLWDLREEEEGHE